MVIIGAISDNLVNLRLDPLPLAAHVSGIDLVIEVANVTHDCAAFQGAQRADVRSSPWR